MQKLDKSIKHIDLAIDFKIKKVSVEMTGNKSDFFGNSKLMSVGFENQGFTVTKAQSTINCNFFGLTLGLYNSVEEVFNFV